MASSIIQSIADCKFKDEYFIGFPKHENPGIIKTLRMLKLFGDVTFEKLRDYEETVNSYLINNNVKVTSLDGNTELGTEIMKRMSSKYKFQSIEKDIKIEIVKKTENSYEILDENKNVRFLTLKLHLDEKDIERICRVMVIYSPVGSETVMQPDTHYSGKGDVYVGMTMTFDSTVIPISIISADIGCGLSVVPYVKENTHVNVSEVEDMEELKYDFLYHTRKSLKRGKVAEKGLETSDYVFEACSFYDDDELKEWLDSMKEILEITGLWREAKNSTYDKNIKNISPDQLKCLMYIGRYALSLGSSGNHFLELTKDDNGYLWSVIHSGSRRLGAMIYSFFERACMIMNDVPIATNELSYLYSKAYYCLDKFAKLNRVMCSISVNKSLSIEFDGSILREHLEKSWIFNIEDLNSDSQKNMLYGLTHNGIKTFINHENKEVLYILNKGSIAISKRSSPGIVALKAGAGCILFTLVDKSCPWIETSITNVPEEYNTIFNIPDGICTLPHGCGRLQATSKTENQFKFEDLIEYFEEKNIVANIAPGILGDHPDGYRSEVDVIKKLPIGISKTCTYLRTLVSYKEGLPTKPSLTKRLGGYVKNNWETMTFNQKRCIDLNTIRSEIGNELYKKYTSEFEG